MLPIYTPRRVCEFRVPCPKIRRIMAPCGEPEASERLGGYSPFQDGVNKDSERSSAKEGLDVQARPERCIFQSRSSQNTRSRIYLKFYWDSQIWQFKTLPFGLSSAPYTFTKLMKPVVATMRRLGIRVVLYLDDMLVMAGSMMEARTHLATALELLTSLGFIYI